MKIFLNGRWLKLKEIPANNSEQGVAGYLQFPGVPIAPVMANWIRLWYNELLAADGTIAKKESSCKLIPFGGNEFGVYEGCLIDTISSESKMYNWRISYREKVIHTNESQ